MNFSNDSENKAIQTEDAVIVAAGFGTRLQPITNSIPKCLVSLGPFNMLEFWLQKCEKAGVKRVFINTHFLNEKVEEFCSQYQSDLEIKLTYEPVLLGTARTLLKLKANLKSPFFLIHADNFSSIDLSELNKFYLNCKEDDCGIASAFDVQNVKGCGIFTIDKDGRIQTFQEKPKFSVSRLANAAVFLLNNQIFRFYGDQKQEEDFCKDILPKSARSMLMYKINGFHIDIGTPENYNKAKKIASMRFSR